MNRFTPPKAEVGEAAARLGSRVPAYTVAAGALLQLCIVAPCAKTYFELISTGAASLLLGLLTFVASLLLYAGAGRLAATGVRGKRSLLLAAVGLVWSAHAWRLPPLWATPFAFGAAVGFAGAWVAMRNQDGVAAPIGG